MKLYPTNIDVRLIGHPPSKIHCSEDDKMWVVGDGYVAFPVIVIDHLHTDNDEHVTFQDYTKCTSERFYLGKPVVDVIVSSLMYKDRETFDANEEIIELKAILKRETETITKLVDRHNALVELLKGETDWKDGVLDAMKVSELPF